MTRMEINKLHGKSFATILKLLNLNTTSHSTF